MAFDLNKSWFGVGEKTGAILVAAGVEHTTGLVVRGTNTENAIGYSLTAVRAGLGLGFSGGLVGLMIFNCDSLQRLQNTEVSDWGVNIAVGGRWSDLVRALRRNEQLIQMARMVWTIRRFGGHAESIRNILHYAYSTYDFVQTNNTPKVIAFDIPLVSAGAEVSISFSSGKLNFF